MSQYSSKDYWEDRYDKESDPFEWFQNYYEIKDIIQRLIPKNNKVLHVGCGTSELGAQMHSDGWTDIVNIDFSGTLIHKLQTRYADKLGLVFAEMNVEELPFATHSFDAIIDKACLDSVICSDAASKHIDRMIYQMHRVLKPGGVFLMVSYGKSELRKKYLDRNELDWSVTVEIVARESDSSSLVPFDDDMSFHYVYICKKVDERKQE
jgi:ubiquinone/menaquinone biosynthesis C-methylase UbiE